MSIARVLVAEDEDDVRRHLIRGIRRENYQVDGARNGDEAIELFKQYRYPAVLLDLRMPGKHGLEVLGYIKDHSPETEVVILSGHGTQEDAIRALNLHAYRYLQKPPNIADVTAALSEALQTYQGGALSAELPAERPDLSEVQARMQKVEWRQLMRDED